MTVPTVSTILASSMVGGDATASSVADSSVADESYLSATPQQQQQQQQEEEDSVHQRASLVLQMANSVVSSNNRRKQQLRQIERGGADHQINTLIDDIMNEKPPNILDLLKEGEPEIKGKPSSIGSGEIEEEKVNDDESSFDKSRDNDEEEEDPDRRYEALLKKYLALKQLQQTDANNSGKGQDEYNNVVPRGSISGSMEDQLKQAYQALVRLKENSELRYSVLESRYLSMKRNLTETTERNNRLEQDLESMRLQLLRIMNNPNGGEGVNSSNLVLDESMLSSSGTPSRRASFSGVSSVGTLSTLKLDGMSNKIQQLQTEKRQNNKQQRLFLQEFHVLCDKVEDCDTCQHHICQATLTKVKAQLAKLMDNSGRGECSEEEEKQMDSDLDMDSIGQSQRSEGTDDLDGSMRSSSQRRNKLAKIDETKLVNNIDNKREKKRKSKLDKMKKKKTNSKFANLSEPKSEQKLRGKKSQFVAAQSGVYCRIDHNMEKKDPNDNNAVTPPPPPLAPALRTMPSSSNNNNRDLSPHSPSAIKQQLSPVSPTDVTKFVHAPSGDYKLVTPVQQPEPEPVVASPSPQPPNQSQQPESSPQALPQSSSQVLPKVSPPAALPKASSPALPKASSPALPKASSPALPIGNSALINARSTSSLPQINESLPLAARSSDNNKKKLNNAMVAGGSARVPGGSARVPGGSARVRKSAVQSPTTTSNNRGGIAAGEEGRQQNLALPSKPAVMAEKRAQLPVSAPPPKIEPATTNQARGQMMESDTSRSGKSPPRGSSLDESERSGKKSNRSGSSAASFHTASEDSLQQRVKAIPPAKLSPEERKAKREAAMREAKATVRSVRKGNFGSIRKNKNAALGGGGDDDASEISGISNVSSVHDLNGEIKNSLRKFKGILEKGKDGQAEKGGKVLFKNPFKRRSTTVDLTSDPVIPIEIVEDVELVLSSSSEKPSSSRRQSTGGDPHHHHRRRRHDDDDDDEEEEEEMEAPAVTRRYSTTDIVAKRIQEMSNNAHVQAQREKIAKGRSNRKAKMSLAAAVEAQQLSLKHLDVKPPQRNTWKPKPFREVTEF